MQFRDHDSKLRWLAFLFGGAVGVAVGLGPSPNHAAAQDGAAKDAEVESPSTAAEIEQWLRSLESETYAVREFATTRLIAAGAPAVQPVFEAIQTGELETIARGNYILRQLAIVGDSPDVQDAALDALTKLSERRFTIAARRASESLQTVYEVRQRNARRLLEELGAEFPVGTPPLNGLVPNPVSVVEILADKWKGTERDLRQLVWLTRFRDEAAPLPWMISMDGNGVDDEWVKIVAGLENVGRVKLRKVNVSSATLGELAQLKELEILELFYNSIDDAAIPHLANLSKLKLLRLIGNDISAAGVDALRLQLPQAEIELKQGGFLGVRCEDSPCRIQFVQPNSAAARAGLRIGDIIRQYDGDPVASMTELSKMIAVHNVDKVVSIDLQRGSRTVTAKNVKLGEWE